MYLPKSCHFEDYTREIQHFWQVNCPLLQAAPDSEELKRRCAALLEAIQELPVIGEQVGSYQKRYRYNATESVL